MSDANAVQKLREMISEQFDRTLTHETHSNVVWNKLVANRSAFWALVLPAVELNLGKTDRELFKQNHEEYLRLLQEWTEAESLMYGDVAGMADKYVMLLDLVQTLATEALNGVPSGSPLT